MIAVIAKDEGLSARLLRDLRALSHEANAFAGEDLDLKSLARQAPQAVVLGLTIWDKDTDRLARRLLAPGAFQKTTPVIAVIAEALLRTLPPDLDLAEVAALPCPAAELGFRLKRALHRYSDEADSDLVIVDDISLSLSGYEVRIKGVPAVLTLKEYELLRHLMTNRGRVYTREQLLDTIWGYDYYGGTRTVDVHIRRVRSKINDIDETYIKTVRGIGYTFRAAE